MNKFIPFVLMLAACGPIVPEGDRPASLGDPDLKTQGSCQIGVQSCVVGLPGNITPPPGSFATALGEQTANGIQQGWQSLNGGSVGTFTVGAFPSQMGFIGGIGGHIANRSNGFYLQNLNGVWDISLSQDNAANNVRALVTIVSTTDYEPIGSGNSFVGESASPVGLEVNPLTSAVSFLAPNTGVDGCFLMSIYGGDTAGALEGNVKNSGWVLSSSAQNSSTKTFVGSGCYVFTTPTNLQGPFNGASVGNGSSNVNTDCGTGFNTVFNGIPPRFSHCVDLPLHFWNGVCYVVDQNDTLGWNANDPQAVVIPGTPKYPNDWVLVESQAGDNAQNTVMPDIQVECMQKAIPFNP
jgi:hypothetical protein